MQVRSHFFNHASLLYRSSTRMLMRKSILITCFLISVFLSFSQEIRQTQTDSYTRYELLAPESQAFRIIYDVSATTAGATKYFNTLRAGSDHKVDAVWDLMSGKELEWEIVDGTKAKANGYSYAREGGEYLMVHLARTIAEGGQARLRIDKTYMDTASYYSENGNIVFDRSLGIKRNSVVLPAGYELTGANYPVQVAQETDGKIRVSFMNDGPAGVPFRITAKPAANMKYTARPTTNPWPDHQPTPSGRDKSKARVQYNPGERSFQNRDIVYFLQQPETHSFFLYHDYTESRIGMDKYVNIVRAGSKASGPSAVLLDTGEKLKVETLVGQQIANKGIEINNLTDDTEAIVIWYEPIKEGETKRLRISETYTDPNRYLLVDDQLIWDRSFGRNRNTVILPHGWMLTSNSIPGKIDLDEEGRIRIRYVNGRPDNIDVFIKAIRR